MKFKIIQHGTEDVGHIDFVVLLKESKEICLLEVHLHTNENIEGTVGTMGEDDPEKEYLSFLFGLEELQLSDIPINDKDLMPINTRTVKNLCYIILYNNSLYGDVDALDDPRKVIHPAISQDDPVGWWFLVNITGIFGR